MKEVYFPCDCKKLPLTLEHKSIERIIAFPNNAKEGYSIYIQAFLTKGVRQG
jgi:hypothetical protein